MNKIIFHSRINTIIKGDISYLDEVIDLTGNYKLNRKKLFWGMYIMSKIATIVLNNSNLETMEVLKTKNKGDNEINIVLAQDGIIYKKEETGSMITKYGEYIEQYSEIEELKDAVLPFAKVIVDNIEYGYATIDYRSQYKNTAKRIYKNKLKTYEKKEMLNKLISLVKKMHEIGFIHGDLHIGNLLYCSIDNSVKLIDFDRMKVQEVDSTFSYNCRMIQDVKYLNLLVLSFLLNKDLRYIDNIVFKNFIDSLSFSSELKSYLIDSFECNNDVKGYYIDEYYNEFTKGLVANGKNLVKQLRL